MDLNKKPLVYIAILFLVTATAGLVVIIVSNEVLYPEKTIDERPEKEISYDIEFPRKIFDISSVQEMGNLSILVNGKETQQLYSTSVTIWNSGKNPIKNTAILYVLSPYDSSESISDILSVNHKTYPELEFGNITLDDSSSDSYRYVYELMNSDDRFEITFLTYNRTLVEVHSKSEGVKFEPSVLYQFPITLETSIFPIELLVMIISVIIPILFFYIKISSERRRKELEEVFKGIRIRYDSDENTKNKKK